MLLLLGLVLQSSLGIQRGLVPGPSTDPKVCRCTSLYIKWANTICPPYLLIQNPRIQRADCIGFSFYYLEVNFTYNKLYIFKVYTLMCLEIYIYIHEIKIQNISLTSKSVLVSLGNLSLLLLLSPATTACFVTVGECAFSRMLYKWNHSVCTLFCQASFI